MKKSTLATLLIWLGFTSAASLAAADERISALFLGANGHHRPLERARQLIPVLKPRGIDIEYTDRVEDLNADKLCLLYTSPSPRD